jgi:hypothetical protein
VSKKGRQAAARLLQSKLAQREHGITATKPKSLPHGSEQPLKSKPLSQSEARQMACSICRTTVQTYVRSDGSKIVSHSQEWREYDHEPDPVPTNYGDQLLVCDYCGDDAPVVVHKGLPLTGRLEVGEKHYGDRFSACGTCDTLVRRRNINALLVRHHNSHAFSDVLAIMARKLGRPLTIKEQLEKRAYEEELIRKFIGTIQERQPLPPPPKPPSAIYPAKLPRIRARLTEMYRGSDYRKILVDWSNSPYADADPVRLPGEDMGRAGFSVLCSSISNTIAAKFSDRMANATESADLIWISRDFTKLAVHAGKRLPDFTVKQEDVPLDSGTGRIIANGLIMFAQPIEDEPLAHDGPPALIVALGWAVFGGGVWITAYAQPDQIFPDDTGQLMKENQGFIIPIAPGSGLQFGEVITEEYKGDSYWRTLLSTWALMAQPGVAAETREQPDKSFARSYARTNKGRTPPSVRLVDLRKQPPRKPTQSGETGTTRTITVRSIVGLHTGGFWRNQPYGSQRSLRKRLWIDPFIRGPDGKPFAHEVKDTVTVLR